MTRDYWTKEFFQGVAVTVIFFLIQAKGQIPGSTKCPEVKLAMGTTANTLSSTWYEVRRYFAPDEEAMKCVTYTFGSPNQTNEMTVEISGAHTKSGLTSKFEGKLTPKNTELSSYDVEIPARPFFPNGFDILGFSPTGEWVVLWSCNDYNKFHIQQAFLLTNTRTPTEEIINEALAVLQENNIPNWLLNETDQDNC